MCIPSSTDDLGSSYSDLVILQGCDGVLMSRNNFAESSVPTRSIGFVSLGPWLPAVCPALKIALRFQAEPQQCPNYTDLGSLKHPFSAKQEVPF